MNSPSHYTSQGMEVIEVIQTKLSQEGFEDYCLGNVWKYTMRFRYKENPDQDLAKAAWYLNRLIESRKSKNTTENS